MGLCGTVATHKQGVSQCQLKGPCLMSLQPYSCQYRRLGLLSQEAASSLECSMPVRFWQVIFETGKQWAKKKVQQDKLKVTECQEFDKSQVPIAHLFSCDNSKPMQTWIQKSQSPGILWGDIQEAANSNLVFDEISKTFVGLPSPTALMAGWVCHDAKLGILIWFVSCSSSVFGNCPLTTKADWEPTFPTMTFPKFQNHVFITWCRWSMWETMCRFQSVVFWQRTVAIHIYRSIVGNFWPTGLEGNHTGVCFANCGQFGFLLISAHAPCMNFPDAFISSPLISTFMLLSQRMLCLWNQNRTWPLEVWNLRGGRFEGFAMSTSQSTGSPSACVLVKWFPCQTLYNGSDRQQGHLLTAQGGLGGAVCMKSRLWCMVVGVCCHACVC